MARAGRIFGLYLAKLLSALDAGGEKVTNLGTPTASTDAATKGYVDEHGSGTRDYLDLSNKPQIGGVTLTGNKAVADIGAAAAVHMHAKTDITDFPQTMPPSAHTHATSEVTGLDTALAGKAASVHNHVKADITDFPTTMPPSAHTHAQTDVNGLGTALEAKRNANDRSWSNDNVPFVVQTAVGRFESNGIVPWFETDIWRWVGTLNGPIGEAGYYGSTDYESMAEAELATSETFNITAPTAGFPSSFSATRVLNQSLALTGEVSGKADKVASATNGNFAALDANGNLTDSTKNASSFDAAGTAASAVANDVTHAKGASAGGQTASTINASGILDVSTLFSSANTSLMGVVRYPLNSAGTILDRNINVVSSGAFVIPAGFTDLLIRFTGTPVSLTFTDEGITDYGDDLPSESGDYLITVTKIDTDEAYIRVVTLEERT